MLYDSYKASITEYLYLVYVYFIVIHLLTVNGYSVYSQEDIGVLRGVDLGLFGVFAEGGFKLFFQNRMGL